MLAKYYIIKMMPINIHNLLIAQLFENAQDTVYGPCAFQIDPDGMLSITPGEFTLSQCGDPSNFRHIDWDPATLNTLSQLGKTLVFGTYRDDQLPKLKKHFSDDIVTVGITHNEQSYNILLHHVAKNHVSFLRTGTIQPNEYDQQLLSSYNNSELINYYMDTFDRMSLLPKTVSIDCDYSIDVADFFNKSKLAFHCSHLNIPITPASEQFYDAWLTLNS